MISEVVVHGKGESAGNGEIQTGSALAAKEDVLCSHISGQVGLFQNVAIRRIPVQSTARLLHATAAGVVIIGSSDASNRSLAQPVLPIVDIRKGSPCLCVERTGLASHHIPG